MSLDPRSLQFLMREDHVYRARYEVLRDQIAEQGVREPIVVSRHRRLGPIAIDDGNHRLRAALELGLDVIPVVFRDLP